MFACVCVGCGDYNSPRDRGDELVIPTDTRAPMVARKKPPPVTGGTLLVTHAGLAVASDPERDAIVIADVATATLRTTIALEPFDEPGRLVEDPAGRVHVALRRGGAVVTIDPVAATVLERRAVCKAPRGIAVSTPSTLEVACADGALVTLPTGAGDIVRRVALEPDLRDVIVQDGAVAVTRFKSAELLRLDASGAVTRRDRPASVVGERSVPLESRPDLREVVWQPFRPLVAWRAVAGPNGSTVVIHQRALEAAIDITKPSANESTYGGDGFSCAGITQNAATVFGPGGATLDFTFPGFPLPVDATLLPDGVTLVVAHAGPSDPHAPRPFVREEFGSGTDGSEAIGKFEMGTLTLVTIAPPPRGAPASEDTTGRLAPCTFRETLPIHEPAVAVAYNPARPAQVVVQTAQPSSLVIIDDIHSVSDIRTVSFDDGATLDTGFQIFHRDSGGGIACATCHAEGAEDGNVWRFRGLGARRTQPLDIGIEGTAPFHWDGTLESVETRMDEIFVGRMGGVHESPERLRGVEEWIFAQRSLPPLRDSSDAAALRGKQLFESESVGCAECHAGTKLTNNQSFDVGTNDDVLLQVPSLVGIGYRAPFMHDGCAPTLAARFDPTCGGGENHGRTKDLTPAQIGDLVAYLESL
jgi:hypothetical protein